MKLEELIEKARKKVLAMDKIDKDSGLAKPQEVSLQAHADTIKAALEAGLNLILGNDLNNGLKTIAEALVILESLVHRLKN
ncbi:hypothetical protein LCGC14_0864440 [marine sediment metagenome]|uniref:Uncharacterized protein n=1 Tax=marine sediment metagenome TaxID=412755 RepID=A0A0F9SDJ1_9ZZZZ